MKKLSPKDLFSKLVIEISERMLEQEQDYNKKIAQLESRANEYHSKNKELSKDFNDLKSKFFNTAESLKTKEKQLEKYKKILNITPGTLENKIELLEYFTETIIPNISEKIESKYTGKIKEYLEREILNKRKEEEKSLDSNSLKFILVK